MKLLNNFSSNKTHDPHGFKEKIKIKFDALKAVAENFPNDTGTMTKLLKAEVPALDWDAYYAIPVAQ